MGRCFFHICWMRQHSPFPLLSNLLSAHLHVKLSCLCLPKMHFEPTLLIVLAYHTF